MSLKKLDTLINEMVRFAPMKYYGWAEKLGGLIRIVGSELYATKAEFNNKLNAIQSSYVFHSNIGWKTGLRTKAKNGRF